MSEMSREARRQNRAKAHRLATQTPGKVDASDYGPEENLEADVKTGMRPVSRRAYKAGGKVEGEKPAQNAGKMQRASGGSVANSIANVDQKAANQERDGVKKVGGLKRGGRAEGGEVPTTRFSINPSGGSRMTQAAGLKAGGRTARSTGGDIALGLASPIGLGIKSLIGGRGDSDKDGKKAGGSVSDGTQQGTRPTGGRIARAAGGKAPEAPHVKRNGYFVPNNSGLAKGRNYNDPGGTAKAEAAERARQPRATGGRTGKTNINIIIGRPSPSGQPDPSGLPPSPGGPGAMPMPVPVGPPGLGAMGAAIPGGPPPGAAPAGAPPPMPMPMGRKSGGRTVMTAGSESGVGRLEKTAIAKKDRLR